MTVAPFGEVKKQVGLETEEAVPVEIENEVKEPESAVSAGSEDITEEDIKASFEHGILTLFVPKKEAKPAVEEKKYISIQ